MRLTVKTNLAMRALMFCAVNSDRVVRKSEIAESCNSSENHLGVVINMLGQTGFIETARGRNGGVKLKVAPEALSVGRVFRVFEANVPFAECFTGSENQCPLTASCKLRGHLSIAVEAFYAHLDTVTLADLVKDNTGLHALLELEPA